MSDTTRTANPEFHAFLANMPVKLPAFVEADLPAAVSTKDGGERSFLKDYSPGSLPWVEAFALTRYPDTAAIAKPENQRFSEGVMRYVGEVFLRSLGGEWDADPSGATTGNGMPFVRPDSKDGEAAGAPVSLVDLLVRAVRERNGQVFVQALADTLIGFGPEGAPFRTCTGIEVTNADGSALSAAEEEFLGTFLGTVEPAIAAWVRDQADPAGWEFGREALERLGKQVPARLEDAEGLAAERSSFWVNGAVRYLGETLRREANARGAEAIWRYGADVTGDDPRAGQPYVLVIGTAERTFVPWQLLRRALTDPTALTGAFDSL
ncbi:hypothetical protein [Brevibacterium samyangense]|uniref:Uncharacterized protein n=1 Tax=Brevibacterium samyangense TaxID=366888 RepID=A0ABN2T7Q2_9MICO